MFRPQHLPRQPARALSALLVLALLLAQLLGLAHRSLHEWDAGRPVVPQLDADPVLRAGASPAPGLGELLQALLGEHADEASCRLYDHAASGEAGLAAALCLPVGCPDPSPGWTPRPAPAVAPATAFLARAPPARG